MIKVCFLCPHTKISGGVKVIFMLAHYLVKSGQFDVTVAPRKFNDKVLAWFTYDINFKLEEFNFETKHDFSNFDIVINYLDGVLDIKGGRKTRHVLFLQGFGTQNIDRETKNLKYPFDAVIATSRWLLTMARNLGHKNATVVPPGVDHRFVNEDVTRSKIPVIGCLYHRSLQKNFCLFEAAIQHIILKLHENVRPLVLTAKIPDRTLALLESNIPTTIIVDPPQVSLPHIYSLCSAWVAPSINEGFGLTPLEAMACGCPTILYPNAGLEGTVVHNVNCLVATTKQEIGQRFLTLKNNKATRNNIIKRGYKTAAKFTWHKSSTLFINALLGVHSGGK